MKTPPARIAAAVVALIAMAPALVHAGARAAPSLGVTTAKYPNSRLAAGESHTCFVVADGSVRCWGDNASGQLGSGPFGQDSNVPVAISTATGLTNAVSVTAGAAHNCALRADGVVFCWGRNSRGQLGNNSGNASNVPVQVSTTTGLTNAVALTAGFDHTCALRSDGAAFCWGDNREGQLGNNTSGEPSRVPVQVTLFDTTVDFKAVALTSGGVHSCAIGANGRMFCWGSNTQGQLGFGATGGSSDVPFPVSTATGLTNVVAVAAGFLHTCALRVDGRLFCWGDNLLGTLGNNSIGGLSNVPVAVSTASGLTNAVALAAGFSHNCALRGDGVVFCWGINDIGELGTGSSGGSNPTPVPVSIANGLANVVALAPGTFHTCALRADSALFCWGGNSSGQLGNQDSGGFELAPVQVSGIAGSISATTVATGGNHSCALRSNGFVACWGQNSSRPAR